MIQDVLRQPAKMYFFGAKPVFEGTLSECVFHWRDNMSALGQAMARVRVAYVDEAVWLTADDLRTLSKEHQNGPTACYSE